MRIGVRPLARPPAGAFVPPQGTIGGDQGAVAASALVEARETTCREIAAVSPAAADALRGRVVYATATVGC